MLSAATEEGQQCGALAMANIAANDSQNVFELGLHDGLVSSLLRIISRCKNLLCCEVTAQPICIVP